MSSTMTSCCLVIFRCFERHEKQQLYCENVPKFQQTGINPLSLSLTPPTRTTCTLATVHRKWTFDTSPPAVTCYHCWCQRVSSLLPILLWHFNLLSLPPSTRRAGAHLTVYSKNISLLFSDVFGYRHALIFRLFTVFETVEMFLYASNAFNKKEYVMFELLTIAIFKKQSGIRTVQLFD